MAYGPCGCTVFISRDVVRRHLLDAGVRRAAAVEALRLEAVQRLVGAELVAEVGELQHADHVRRDVEERRLRARRLDRHERRPARAPALVADHRRPARRWSGASNSADDRDALAGPLLDQREQPRGEQRVAAEVEEVVVDADRRRGRGRSDQMPPSVASRSSRGATPSSSAERRVRAAGSALRSILRFGVIGKRSMGTKATGPCTRAGAASASCRSSLTVGSSDGRWR